MIIRPKHWCYYQKIRRPLITDRCTRKKKWALEIGGLRIKAKLMKKELVQKKKVDFKKIFLPIIKIIFIYIFLFIITIILKYFSLS